MSDNERWIPVPNYEGWYEISDHGRVRKIRRSKNGHRATSSGPLPHVMAPLRYQKGYYKIHFASCDGTKPEKRMFLHRAVYIAFHGPIPPNITVNHKDGNKANNRLDNLELASQQDQHDHAVKTGLKPKPKLTYSDADDIRDLYRTGQWSQPQIAKLYGVSQSLVAQLVKKPSWTMLNDNWFGNWSASAIKSTTT